MTLFDTLIVQPIFNLLVAIYGIIPGGDFGISIILFTIIIRLLMWPLVKKQLHQTKVMRAIQPELKKIKAKAKGNKQLEAQMMMELYRERGVNPFGAIGLLLVQLPIFFALFRVIQIITSERDRIGAFTYDFLEGLGPINQIITDPKHDFNESLLNIINLTDRAITNEINILLVLLAVLAAGLQYWQSKQITPEPTEHKRLRDLMSASAKGKEVDQTEISAVMSQRMIIIFPFITFFVALYLPGALVLYYAASSAVAIIQQHIVLNRDVEEMETIADKTQPTSKQAAEKRASTAVEATVVTSPKKAKSKKRKKR